MFGLNSKIQGVLTKSAVFAVAASIGSEAQAACPAGLDSRGVVAGKAVKWLSSRLCFRVWIAVFTAAT